MQHRNALAVGAAGALLLCLGVGPAQAGSSLTEAQVTAKLKAAGYTSIHDVELEGGHFDADAVKAGRPVHLHVDAQTGVISPVAHESEEDEEAEEHEEHKKP